MSASTWRGLSGYATYQRTPVRMISLGKWAPLKLTAMVVLPHGFNVGHSKRAYLKSASNEKCDRTRDGARRAVVLRDVLRLMPGVAVCRSTVVLLEHTGCIPSPFPLRYAS